MSLSFYLDKPSRHRRLGTPGFADNKIRAFFYEKFPHTRRVVLEQNRKLAGADTILPQTGDEAYPYGEVGMAIDYRIRYYVEVTPFHNLVAARGAKHVSRFTDALPEGVISDFIECLKRTLVRIDPSQKFLSRSEELEINCYCFWLALFEQAFRVGRRSTNSLLTQQFDSVSELLAVVKDEWLEDLCALSWRFYESCKDLLDGEWSLNPTFQGSADIGGADADLIVDSCLIDIKTTINPIITNTMLYQLLGYALLDYEDQYELRNVGIYLSRQGTLATWSLTELADRMFVEEETPPIEDLRAQFKEAVLNQRAAERRLRNRVIAERLRRIRIEASPFCREGGG